MYSRSTVPLKNSQSGGVNVRREFEPPTERNKAHPSMLNRCEIEVLETYCREILKYGHR